MSRMDTETKRKLREMGAAASCWRPRDPGRDARASAWPSKIGSGWSSTTPTPSFTHAKVEGLIRRAGLRYPSADLRRSTSWTSEVWTGTLIEPARHLLVHRPAAERRLPRVHRVREVLPGMRDGQTRLRTPHPRPLRPHARPRGSLGAAQGQAPGGIRQVPDANMRPSPCWSLTSGCWIDPDGIDAHHAAGTDGTPLRRDVNSVLHPVLAEGLAPAARLRRSRRCDHGPDHPQHDLGRDRQLQHARAHSTRNRLATVTEGVSGARPRDRWRSLARTPALNRTNKWRSKLQILRLSRRSRLAMPS